MTIAEDKQIQEQMNIVVQGDIVTAKQLRDLLCTIERVANAGSPFEVLKFAIVEANDLIRELEDSDNCYAIAF